MTFVRQPATQWHKEVPGSRWFKADLHVHTIDDLPGGRAKMPVCVQGNPLEPRVLRDHARAFLQGAVHAGVQVVGLTPHASRIGDAPETSAVWHIVEVWNSDDDNDGVPFREKIYALFPGFEPTFKEGREGLHLLLLFDPEVGRARYLDLFSLAMGGVTPWRDGNLQVSNRTASEAFNELHALMEREAPRDQHGVRPWDVLVLAPHVDAPKGLFGAQKAQVLALFEHSKLAGLELPDNKLPADLLAAKGDWLREGMNRYRHAFFHASDAYKVAASDDATEHELGYRTTWVKLASPRIEALRQAFIASESRLRIAYDRAEDGSLRPLPEPPDPLKGKRRWLRRVTVQGGAAFFGGRDDDQTRPVEVELSPDLTCIIGGAMTGKSTLLDGLRVHVGAELPLDSRLRAEVEKRGAEIFLAGQPEVRLDTPGGGTDAPHERWPAVFFTQNELQRLAQDPGAVQDILARLVPAEQAAMMERDERLATLDNALSTRARMLEELLDQRAEAEQQLAAAREARKALDDFEQAGLATMQASERLQAQVDRALADAGVIREQIKGIADLLRRAAIDAEIEPDLRACLERMQVPPQAEGLGALHAQASEGVEFAAGAVAQWVGELERVREVVGRAVLSDRQAVEKRLAEIGYGAEKLAEFQALSRRAGKLASHEASFEELRAELQEAQDGFDRDHAERERLLEAQREAFDRVRQAVKRQFHGRIRVRRVDHGISDSLASFLIGLKQKGITQWWNSLDPDRRPAPELLFQKLQAGKLGNLGVSSTVAERFQEAFGEARRYELRALRSPDRYVLELRVADEEYREADRLSGGKRVSLLLSLLLEAHDDRPLVIDQPEDQLDNRFLWNTVLPALLRLKGRRQVIVATHNANIVVNGDADLVVQLEADAERGRVAISGAIEDPAVRTGILETVDGGRDAFELRKTKYGF